MHLNDWLKAEEKKKKKYRIKMILRIKDNEQALGLEKSYEY